MPSAVLGLVRSCHPVPTAGVTLLSAGLAAVAGLGWGTGVLLVAAVLAGQLSIGWSNDWLDAARDRAVARRDKPVAAGQVPLARVGGAAFVALVAAVGLSLALGVRAGLAALVLVAAGWIYNLGVKGTVASFLPYAAGFGALPAAATLALAPPRAPALWAVLAGAVLGVAAHLANVLPDLAADAATGVRGLPHRLGARVCAVTTPVLLFVATVLIVAGPGGHAPVPDWRLWLLLPVGVVTGYAAVAGWRRPGGRRLFLGALLVAGADLLLFGLSGGALT